MGAMGDAVERQVRLLVAFAAESGQRIAELRVSGDSEGLTFDVSARYEKEVAADGVEWVRAARCAADARCAAPDAAGDADVRADAHADGDGAGARGARAGAACHSNGWTRQPGGLQRRARCRRRGAASRARRTTLWVAQSFRRTRARNLIVAAVRRRAAQLLVAARAGKG